MPRAYPALAPLLAAHEPRFRAVLDEIERHAATLLDLDGPPPAPRFDQEWFARCDAAAAYAIVRRHAPRRIVEIGSGHSTRFLARAVADAGLATTITCIDPQPRAALTGLAVEHLALRLDQVPGSIVAELAAGDIVFLDSSHVAVPGSDVEIAFSDLLPRLPAGALVHVHDVFLPDPYPDAWRWRGYNEQSLVACLLQGGGYTPIFASHWVTTRMADAVDAGVLARLPLRPGVPESSLWLRKDG